MTNLLDDDLFLVPEKGSVWDKAVFDVPYDPFDILTSVFHVKTKQASIRPFNPFRTQRLFVENMGLRNVVVKPRQVGLSTIILGLETALAITCTHLNILVITHRDDTTDSFRDTIRGFINRANEHFDMGITIDRDNADVMHLKETDCTFFFGSGTAPGVGRSRTIQILHGSELAHWPGADPGAELGGMTESIPDDGMEFIESSPNGAAGPFYEAYADPTNSYVKHFYPWFIEPSRRLKLPPGTELHLNAEEQILVTMHSLSHEQIAWRRAKMAMLRSKGLDFRQEYPEDDRTCFVAGLKSPFDATAMARALTIAEMRSYAEYAVPGTEQDPGGRLRVWEEPRPGVPYVMACDVGGGNSQGDFSVGLVRNGLTGEHVATLSGHWKPRSFGRETVAVAHRFNDALLCHESNGLGQGAVEAATTEMRYPNYFFEERVAGAERIPGVPRASQSWYPGMNISSSMIATMGARIIDEFSEGRLNTPDVELLKQMSTARYERRQIGVRAQDVLIIPKAMHNDWFMAYGQSCLLMGEPMAQLGRRAGPQAAL